MDRNPYHGSNPQQQQGNASYSWSQPNGMLPPFRPPEPADPSANAHSSRMPNGHMFYGQAQADQTTAATLYTQPYHQPPYADNRTSQYGQQNINPWGQYSQGQPYNTTSTNTALPPPPPGQSYNQYMYPPPPSQTTTNMPNHNQGQAMPSYSPSTVHSYYQMQQAPNNYYYPSNQMYPNAVPPPPLPQQPPLPPQPSTAKGQTHAEPNGSSSRENTSTSKPDDHKLAKTSSLTDTVASTSTSSRDRKASAPADDKEKDDKDTKKAVPIMVGKRRGGRVLPTGVVKKQKVDDGNSKGKSDAWSQYMEEVRRYKDQSCTEERQNRPLVK